MSVETPVILGVPTIADRIAQQVVKARIEGELEGLFHLSLCGTVLAQDARQSELGGAAYVGDLSSIKRSLSVAASDDLPDLSGDASMRCAVNRKSPSDERSAGNRHATFCGSREPLAGSWPPGALGAIPEVYSPASTVVGASDC